MVRGLKLLGGQLGNVLDGELLFGGLYVLVVFLFPFGMYRWHVDLVVEAMGVFLIGDLISSSVQGSWKSIPDYLT